MSVKLQNWICTTRAIKNARYLQKVAPNIIPTIEPAGGFGSVIPLQLLAQLHTNVIGADSHLAGLLKDVKFPILAAGATDPLFKGTLFFLHISFTIQDQNNAVVSISDQDINVAVDYSVQASPPISRYAAQYGSNSVNVSLNIIPYNVTLATARYNDAQLQAWVNDAASQLATESGACIVVLNPQGVVNVNGDPANGIGGYHSMANVPYIFLNVAGQNLTIADEGFLYAGNLSHEIAEMVVDPLANVVNPEVCDPCGPNCTSTFLDYFDNSGNYIATSQAFPPGFPYHFYINGIIKPEYGSCPTFHDEPQADQDFACNYSPIVRTDVAPGVAGVGNNVYFFQKSLDARVFYNRAMLGQAGLGWAVVEGKGLISSAPAAGGVGTHVFVAARGLDGNLYLNQADLGGHFNDFWSPMNFNTNVAPAVVGAGNNVEFFAIHPDGRVFYDYAQLGQGGQGWNEVPGDFHTDAAPAAGAIGTYVYVVIKAPDGTLWLNQGELGQGFVGWEPMS